MSESGGRKQFDIYRDPNVSEAVLCRPVLDGLVEKVSQLLLAFPDHPTLMQVSIICSGYNIFMSAYYSLLHLVSEQPCVCGLSLVTSLRASNQHSCVVPERVLCYMRS